MHMYLLAASTFALTAGAIGYSKGRNGMGWFLSGFLIGPFALVVAALPPLSKQGLHRKCPYCAEVIHADVRVCRYCKSELQDAEGRMGGSGGPPHQLPQEATLSVRDQLPTDAP